MRPSLAMRERLLLGGRARFLECQCATALRFAAGLSRPRAGDLPRRPVGLGAQPRLCAAPQAAASPISGWFSMSKHLRRAALRIPAVTIDDAGRRELGDLLHAAADAAEQILRRQFEPVVAETLTAARFTPGSVVERVGSRKLNQELLDGVVDRGFLTLGDLRDAISRNLSGSPLILI